ncbi:MAG: hypothetical protein DRP87_05890 [Spirochaetes bacterium]|nr:MAG: hypothetical protein DRP87_05890 [Spirochaetota bacterium]
MIKIPAGIVERIKKQAMEEAPIEACGYLGGRGDVVREIFPMTNTDKSPEHFSFSPEEQFEVLNRAREMELELIAVYHSHPATPARMSEEDIRLAYDPDFIYLIYSLSDDKLKAFRVIKEEERKQVLNIPIEEIQEEPPASERTR